MQGLKIENVECCYQLAVGDLGRGLLRSDLPGLTVAWKKHGFIPVVFKVLSGEQLIVQIKYPRGDFAMKQAVRITTSPTIFGHRPYFTCTCGRRGKLYLRPGIDFWQCRRCLNLRYEVQRMSKKSCIGLLGYYLNRQMKISWMAGEIKRIEYGGKLTRRARALVQKSRKWKLNDQTKGRIEILKPG